MRSGSTIRRGLRAWMALWISISLAPTAFAQPADPVPVFYPAKDCHSGVLELEVWNRETEAWDPHPEHPRIFANSCQVEDAGVLLNETRMRCLRREGTTGNFPWRVGVDVWNPDWMDRCPVLMDPPSAGPYSVRLSRPAPGAEIRYTEPSVEIEGWVALAGREVPGHDLMVLVDASPRILELERKALSRLLDVLAARPEPYRVGIATFSSAPSAAGTRAVLELGFGADLGSAHRALERAAAPGVGTVAEPIDVLERAVEILVKAAGPQPSDEPTPQQTLVLIVDGTGPRPFGATVGLEPEYRARLLDLARRARRRGLVLHTIVLAGSAGAPAELARQLRAELPGSLRWTDGLEQVEPLADELALCLVPEVTRLEVLNLDSGQAASDVAVLEKGRFEAIVPLRGGSNRVVVRAQLASGVAAEGEFVFFFDADAERAAWLKAERARIERERDQRGRKHIVVEIDE